jgi:hypothetical protein
MMDRTELVDAATQLIDYYKDKLILDQFWNFKVEVSDGDFYCDTIKDPKSALCWVIKLNPEQHSDVYDVQYSIVEALLKVLLGPLEGEEGVKNGITARLATALCNALTENEEEYVEEEEDDDEYE